MDMQNKFYKVNNDNGGVEVATFYNPITREEFSQIVWDIDDDRLLFDEDIQKLRFMSINEEVRHLWFLRMGVISIGDKIEVVKGRKVPVGSTHTVKDIQPWYDKYGRRQNVYLYFTDGLRTSVKNCKLIYNE